MLPGWTRELAKRAAYRSGALGARSRVNRGHLTVVTLHRVLPSGDPAWVTADPRYTITGSLFTELLEFFHRHYDLVGMDLLLESARSGRELPARPLLVTLDDGWADTEEHALEILVGEECPATVFVTSGALGRRVPFWRERLFAACRAGQLRPERAARLWAAVKPAWPPLDTANADAVRAFVRRVDALRGPARARAIAEVERLEDAGDGPGMLTFQQLRRLRDAGVAIGAHGASHEAIPMAADPSLELAAPRAALAVALGGDPDAVRTMSFPHGSYDPVTVARARTAGYELIFTSDANLNALRGGRLASDLIGRIGIPGPAVADERGRLRPDLLALWLFRRPRALLEVAA